jgi:6-hydroxycyclohex-1-ene-1-carbonyl-CoA dehydrogenase
MENKMYAWKMTELNADFELIESPFPALNDDEVLVKIAGCGVCHTDISFWHYGVKTKHELPLTLGHEISGKVVAGNEKWMNKKVIIPAVLPCGRCALCYDNRSNICQNQLMPGNDFDGGFASHVKVPYKYLCPVPEEVLDKYPLKLLSVVADAISTPYQVVKKSGLKENDFAIIIGVGGIGIYGVQIAKITGAKVLALDISDDKLNTAKANGADAILNIKDLDIRSTKKLVRGIASELEASPFQWKIFEMSGTKAGQELGFNLLTFASSLSIVGFTLDKLEVRLSNLMAFDAQLIGTWGCKPELYPEVVDLLAQDKIQVDQLVETFPLSKINEIFHNTLDHKYNKRSILVPDFD